MSPREKEAIVRYLSRVRGKVKSEQIARALRMSHGSVRRSLHFMVQSGEVKRESRGCYVLSSKLWGVPIQEPSRKVEPQKGSKSKHRVLQENGAVQVTLPEIFGARIGPETTINRIRTIRERDKQKRAIVETVMKLILSGTNSPTQLSKMMNFKVTKLSYYMNLMRDEGLIKRRVRSTISIYEVTPRGISLLKATQSGLPVGRFENFRIDYPVLKDNPQFLPSSQGNRMKNNVRETIGTISVDGNDYTVGRWHAPSGDQIYVWAQKHYTTGEVDAIHDGTIEVSNVAREIQRRYGMTFGRGRVTHSGEIEFDDQFAKWFVASGGPIVKNRTEEGSVWIDSSPRTSKKMSAQAKSVARGEIGFSTSGDETKPGMAQGYLDLVMHGPRALTAIFNMSAESLEQAKANNALLKELIQVEKETVESVKEMAGTIKEKMEAMVSKFDSTLSKLATMGGTQEQAAPKTENERKTDSRRYA